MSLHWVKHEKIKLAIMPRPRGGDWLEDDVNLLKRAGVDVLVSLLTLTEIAELNLMEEGAVCAVHGLQFRNYPIEDRSVPANLSDFLEFVGRLDADLRAGLPMAIHCRAGIGRSSLVAGCLLIRQGLPLEDSWRAIEEARGCPVPDTPEQREWLRAVTIDLWRNSGREKGAGVADE